MYNIEGKWPIIPPLQVYWASVSTVDNRDLTPGNHRHVSGTEGDEFGSGQHQRRGVVQTEVKLYTEDAQTQAGLPPPA